MGLGQQFAEPGSDEGHLVEFGALFTSRTGGGDQGDEALELGVPQGTCGLAKRGDGLGKRLRWLM